MASPSQIKFIGEGERQIDISFFLGRLVSKDGSVCLLFAAEKPSPLFRSSLPSTILLHEFKPKRKRKETRKGIFFSLFLSRRHRSLGMGGRRPFRKYDMSERPKHRWRRRRLYSTSDIRPKKVGFLKMLEFRLLMMEGRGGRKRK